MYFAWPIVCAYCGLSICRQNGYSPVSYSLSHSYLIPAWFTCLHHLTGPWVFNFRNWKKQWEWRERVKTGTELHIGDYMLQRTVALAGVWTRKDAHQGQYGGMSRGREEETREGKLLTSLGEYIPGISTSLPHLINIKIPSSRCSYS